MKIVTKLSDLFSCNPRKTEGIAEGDRGISFGNQRASSPIIGLFRRKPVVVKAVRLTEVVLVKTLEGELQGNIGDWLIEGVKKEVYPCRPDIFEQTYEGFSSADTELMKTELTSYGQFRKMKVLL